MVDMRIGPIYQGLIFLLILTCCKPPSETVPVVSIVWDEDRAVGVFIPKQFIDSLSGTSISKALSIHLMSGGDQPAILGEYSIGTGGVIFKPMIPFTRKLKYEIRLENQHVAMFEVPTATTDQPRVTGIYPSADTLPENLLKVYIAFSRPMREHSSLDHVKLISNEVDTLSDVFLDLEPELWNRERTQLTLWLDPGRIKRDLQPNRRMGAPLTRGQFYKILVLGSWEDQAGAALQGVYKKDFVASHRDTLSPDPEEWVLRIPLSGSSNPLEINFPEPLDYSLVREAIAVFDESGRVIEGTTDCVMKETLFQFRPVRPWAKGKYSLRVETRLEDLAGNNLVRPFDRDITATAVKPQDIYVRDFIVR